MSSKIKTVYRCSECGAESAKWGERCEACGEWNTLAEEPVGTKPVRRQSGMVRAARPLHEVTAAQTERWTTGLDEFDFVLGGGIVPGSMVLVGGEPGIGKSTLLLQVAARLTGRGRTVLYMSGEESPPQVKLRADRLGGAAHDVRMVAETNLENVLATAREDAGGVLIVDSIQTLYSSDLEGAPGNVGQVRECAARLMRFAKDTGTAVVVVGHVTKGGGIAGPKTLEHIVDTVLYFEGETTLDHRILRATKNRFGGVDEIGVFRMTETGLSGVANPSELFLGDRQSSASGTAVTALIEGTRPVLIEIQALAAKAGFGTPQRVSTGLDGRRLALLLAVLDKRAGLSFAMLDVFVNVVGGMRLIEPAGDLAVAAALASSVYDRSLPSDAIFIGEVGLGGEVRPVSQIERRMAEAVKMGCTRAFVAERAVPSRSVSGITAIGVPTIHVLFQRLFA
ncbi:MAG TPA: DNA repair protein RadA [Gemmatimonadaceae bacterium]|nr:DNA repair protein RadA [Gemmatimonadaceae bacterium]